MNIEILRDKIAQNKLEEAMDDILAFIHICKEDENNLIHLKGRYSENEDEKIAGTRSDTDYSRELNNIRKALLHHLKPFSKICPKKEKKIYPFLLSISQVKQMLNPTVRDRYEIGEEITSSDRTIIFLAENKNKANDPVAIKCIMTRVLEENENSFKEKIEKIEGIGHPNIVRIYGVKTNEIPHVIMSYVKGFTLNDRVKVGGVCTLREALDIIIKLIHALNHLNNIKLLDTHIYPDRIFINKKGELIFSPYIIFSADNKLSSESKLKEFFTYLSPEQVNGQDNEDPRKSWQFSLGALSFFLLTGEHVFEGDSLFELIESRIKFFADESNRKGRMDLLKGKNIPDEVINMIDKLLMEDPENRSLDFDDLPYLLENCKPQIPQNYGVIRNSYFRCFREHKDFTEKLFNDLIEEYPNASERFEKVKSDEDKNVIFYHALQMILESTPENPEYLKFVIDQRENYGLGMDYYDTFFEVLMKNLSENDPHWDDKLEKVWTDKKTEILTYIDEYFSKSEISHSKVE